ncbi:tellurite resistance TerB family protein [Vibrio sp. JPW-9-11-11]|uniref:tellurite resistance TerB family protein n=1 Tax=Vibrio sp. JPW-9-11-11 TaxID=1416532 RepID=UPI001592F338|nr:tellurite resistance TerB family protein [Vibrio sp. JPW-9-11-11]NVD06055.1 tellurite resistance TerB family protein [Vibrio sp. JPW-9-11-11]
MDLKSLLNQALNSDLVRQGQQQIKQSSQSNTLKSLGAGAVGGGLVSLLMGSKKSKKFAKKTGKNALKIGGVAALGALAYKIYNDTQKKPAQHTDAAFNANDPVHYHITLKAMIAAAKADGHVDQVEMARIESAIEQSGADQQVRSLVHQELNKPLDPIEIAQLATTPQQAAEIYLASLIVIDEQNTMEKVYLNELAKQLKLQPEVIEQLHLQLNQFD